MVIIATSSWQLNTAKKSSLFKSLIPVLIPNNFAAIHYYHGIAKLILNNIGSL